MCSKGTNCQVPTTVIYIELKLYLYKSSLIEIFRFVAQLVTACSTLHNLCIDRNIPLYNGHMGNNEDGFHMNINEDVRENAGGKLEKK